MGMVRRKGGRHQLWKGQGEEVRGKVISRMKRSSKSGDEEENQIVRRKQDQSASD